MHHIVLYPQNGDRIVTTDSVTSLHTMYNFGTLSFPIRVCVARRRLLRRAATAAAAAAAVRS